VTFTTKYKPYQLYPEASEEGEDKYAWYQKSRYPSDDQMQKYTRVMGAYGAAEGIDFKFGGTVANTLHAHRMIQHFQEEKGAETADKIVKSLYKQYFEEERHPASDETLLRAATEAGIDEKEAKEFIGNRNEGLRETQMLLRDSVSNQVDSVPRIVFEGKRRDIELEGAKEVAEYVAALNKIIKESS
jgi:predicted DsbA family dithiol-disulfide isomerase